MEKHYSETLLLQEYLKSTHAASKLRVLAFTDEDDEPQSLSANMSGDLVLLEPSDDVYKYRITLPEWMVEPGQ